MEKIHLTQTVQDRETGISYGPGEHVVGDNRDEREVPVEFVQRALNEGVAYVPDEAEAEEEQPSAKGKKS